jgi:hypothetical protein
MIFNDAVEPVSADGVTIGMERKPGSGRRNRKARAVLPELFNFRFGSRLRPGSGDARVRTIFQAKRIFVTLIVEDLIHQSDALQITLKHFQGSARHTGFAHCIVGFLRRDPVAMSGQKHLDQLGCVAGIKSVK